MICQRCGGDFPGKRGRYCGTCLPRSRADALADVLAEVLVAILAENAHQLVGGVAFAQESIDRIRAAQHPTPHPAGQQVGEGA